ncbi:hypothetical protein UT300018_05710 [Clostridium faecium]
MIDLPFIKLQRNNRAISIILNNIAFVKNLMNTSRKYSIYKIKKVIQNSVRYNVLYINKFTDLDYK